LRLVDEKRQLDVETACTAGWDASWRCRVSTQERCARRP